MREPYTIDDMARELGVSKTTISRAISGKGRISEETRQRVLALMREHDYRPSAAARSLANNKTYTLAMVLPEDGAEDEMPFFQHCLTGACAVAARQDYDILITTISPGSLRRLERVLANRKVDGVILTRGVSEASSIRLMRDSGLPFVLIGSSEAKDVLWVDHDHRRASAELTGLLLTMGLRKPVLLAGDLSLQINQSRLQGFQDACGRFGLDSSAERVYPHAEQAFYRDDAIEDCLRQGAECILCTDEGICQRTMARLQALGVDVPGRVCVASFNDSGALQHGVPSVTSLQFEPKLLGMEACRMLLNLLEGQRGESRLLPTYQIALRDSTKRY